jgi:hypothetical protein
MIWYETHQTAFGLKEGCIGKQDHCNNCKICVKPPKDIVESPVTSTCLSVDCLESKTDRMLNKLLRKESAARCKHHMQVKLECCYIGKES